MSTATKKASESLPPHNLEAEQAILGAILLNSNGLDRAREIIGAEDLYREAHRKIFRAMGELRERGLGIELVGLVDHLEAKGLLQGIGGATYISHLASCTPTAANLPFHCRIVKEKALLRRLQEYLQKASARAEEGDLGAAVEVAREISTLSLGVAAELPLRRGADLLKLDLTVAWAVEGLLPLGSITLLHGRSGIGKTWLALQLAASVAEGTDFACLKTLKMPAVYIDFENALSVLVARIKAVGAGEVLFWHGAQGGFRPPRLDEEAWTLYKALPRGLIIIDTLRAAQGKDENSSQDMAFIMNRLKELRDMGFTVLLLHHSPKGNHQQYKGSTAIQDLADHVLGLHKVSSTAHEEVEEDEDGDYHYRLGTVEKSRYEPFHVFLAFDPRRGFLAADDPREGELLEIKRILEESGPMNQTDLCKTVKEIMGLGRKERVLRLLKRGEGKLWQRGRDGRRVLYLPICSSSVSLSPLIKGGTIETNRFDPAREDGNRCDIGASQTVDNSQLSACPPILGTDETDTPLTCSRDSEKKQESGTDKCARCGQGNSCRLSDRMRAECEGPFDD